MRWQGGEGGEGGGERSGSKVRRIGERGEVARWRTRGREVR